MANLQGKLSSVEDTVFYTKANGYYNALNNKMQETINSSLTLKSAYASKYDIVEQLRVMLKDEFKATPPPDVGFEGEFERLIPLLDVNKTVAEIAAIEADFKSLETYINSCADSAKGAFEPTLAESFQTSTFTVNPIPNSTELDIRRFARVFYFETPFNTAQKSWLTNNALLYGFTMYEDYALYYIGFSEAKGLVSSDGVAKVINRFQRTPIPTPEINITAGAVLAAIDPIEPVIESTGNGTMYFSNTSNPLLVVFGGIDVNGEASGIYMPKYFDSKYDKYNIWIANSSRVGGADSYGEALTYLSQKGATPSSKILYCFSGGNKPGKALISNGKISDFNKVLLVDIWMKGDSEWPTWVSSNASKTTYFYTSYGSNGGVSPAPEQDSIIQTLGYPTPKASDTSHYVGGSDAHMRTNELAIATL